MKHRRFCLSLLLIAFSVFCNSVLSPWPIEAAELKVSGNWPPFRLTTTPTLSNQPVSTAGAVLLSVVNTSNTSSFWIIRAEVINPNPYSSNIGLLLRRTGDGLGPGWISGGKTLSQLGTRPLELIRGKGDRTNIPLQLKVTSFSPVTIPGMWDQQIRFTLEVEP